MVQCQRSSPTQSFSPTSHLFDQMYKMQQRFSWCGQAWSMRPLLFTQGTLTNFLTGWHSFYFRSHQCYSHEPVIWESEIFIPNSPRTNKKQASQVFIFICAAQNRYTKRFVYLSIFLQLTLTGLFIHLHHLHYHYRRNWLIFIDFTHTFLTPSYQSLAKLLESKRHEQLSFRKHSPYVPSFSITVMLSC